MYKFLFSVFNRKSIYTIRENFYNSCTLKNTHVNTKEVNIIRKEKQLISNKKKNTGKRGSSSESTGRSFFESWSAWLLFRGTYTSHLSPGTLITLLLCRASALRHVFQIVFFFFFFRGSFVYIIHLYFKGLLQVIHRICSFTIFFFIVLIQMHLWCVYIYFLNMIPCWKTSIFGIINDWRMNFFDGNTDV